MIDVPVRTSSDIAAQKTKCSLQLVKSHHYKGTSLVKCIVHLNVHHMQYASYAYMHHI